MVDNRLKKLSRRELLEILIAQQKEIESLQAQLHECQEALESKRIKIEESGSIAEASIALNHVLEQAQLAADQYLFNLRVREEDIKRKEAETLQWCEEMKRCTKEECANMIRNYQQQIKSE